MELCESPMIDKKKPVEVDFKVQLVDDKQYDVTIVASWDPAFKWEYSYVEIK